MSDYYIAIRTQCEPHMMYGPYETWDKANDAAELGNENGHFPESNGYFIVMNCPELNEHGASKAYPWGDLDSEVDEDNIVPNNKIPAPTEEQLSKDVDDCQCEDENGDPLNKCDECPR